MCTDILMPDEMRLVPSIKMKLGDDLEFYCSVLSFLGTPDNTFRYYLNYLHNEIVASSAVSEKSHLLPSTHDRRLENQFKQLNSLTEAEGKVLERLGKCIVDKGLFVKGQVECIFFNNNK